MDENLETLKRFVLERGRPVRSVVKAFERLEPFFQSSVEPPYSLARPDRRSVAEISGLISRLIGREPERLVIISLRPGEGPRTIAQSSAVLRERLTPKIWHTFGNHLQDRYGAVGRARLAVETERELRRLVESCLGGNQLDSLIFSLRDIIGEPFVDVVCHYLAAFMAGDEWAFGELARLAEWAPRLLPLGDHPGYPGTWYVLSA